MLFTLKILKTKKHKVLIFKIGDVTSDVIVIVSLTVRDSHIEAEAAIVEIVEGEVLSFEANRLTEELLTSTMAIVLKE